MQASINRLSTAAKKILPRNTFARSVSVLAGGTVIAQLLVIVAAPLLTRLYDPQEFGLLSVYTSLLAIFVVLSGLRYEIAIAIPESNQEAANITALCLLLISVATTLSALAVLFGRDAIAHLLNAPSFAAGLWLLPVGVFFASLYQALNYWTLRQRDFAAIARIRLKQSIATAAIQLLGYKLGLLALLIGHAAGQGTSAWLLGKAALKHKEFEHVTAEGMWAAAKCHRNFPIFSTWSGLLDVGSSELPPMMFAVLFNPAAAGLYALSNRVLALPMIVVGTAISNVLFVDAAQAWREGRLAPLVATVQEKLAHIVMPMAIVLLIAGPDLFAIVFGEKWREAGVFAQWMAPWLYVRFVTSPLSALMAIMNKQRQDLVFYSILFIVHAATIAAGAALGDLATAIALFSVGSMLCWIGYLIWITNLTGNTVASLVKSSIAALAWGVACAIPLLLGLLFLKSGHLWLVALATTALLIGTRFYFLMRPAYQ